MITVCHEYNLFNAMSRGTIGIIVLVSNLMTIVALSKATKGIGQKAKLYIMSLSCADILMSPAVLVDILLDKMKLYCLSVPNAEAITEEVVWKKRLIYSVIATLGMISLGASLATLVCMAIDRLLAVSKPVFYKNHVTKSKITCIIIFLWLYMVICLSAVIIYSGSTTSPERVFFASDTPQVVPDFHYNFIILPHVYFFILANVVFFGVTIFYIRRLDAKKTTQVTGESFKRTKLFVKMTGMTLASFFILWTPYLIIVNVVDRTDPNLPIFIRDYVVSIAYSIMFCNSWINPILYCYFNKNYREAYKQLLHIRSKQIHADSDTSATCQ